MEVSDRMGPKSTSSREAAIRTLFGSSRIFQSPELKLQRPDLCADLILKDKANHHYEAGMAAMLQSHFERAVICFSKAITLQPERTQLYVERAESHLQLCDFRSAALDYKHACYLEPHTRVHLDRLAFIHYLQGQCHCDQGMFLEALESFAKAIELRPDFRPYHMRSLVCLSALGRYSDCIRLVTNWIETDTPTPDLFTLRARLYHQLNQATLCYFDLKSALRLDPNCWQARDLLEDLQEAAERSSQGAIAKALEGELSDALVKITSALEQSPEKAQYYLFRGILYRRLKDFTAAIEDLALAVELGDARVDRPVGSEPDRSAALQEDGHAQLVLAYNDFAVHCFSRGFYNEAVMLLTRAIHEQRDESGLFINRGDCFYMQKDWRFALADYQQAEELDPSNASIPLRVATAHNALGLHSYNDLKFQEAVEEFSAAVERSPGIARFYRNRAKAYSRMDRVEEAKQDAICALILDPSDDELVPLVLSLFPGCSLSDVTSSTAVQTVRAGLMKRVQACRRTASPVSRLCGKLERTVLEHDGDGQSDTDSQSSSGGRDVEAGREPRLFSHQLARGEEQVAKAVKRVLQQRQPLHHPGPRLAPLRTTLRAQQQTSSTAPRPYAWRDFGGVGLSC
ncbi:tetratricopeptide repeat protein 16-like [Brachyhypopomus gauderio]|uniref:tetratricopeptide repeat protein 16-like n=1 Tax=Brachyhypopomus gauderio TaxID=698409 RepID=UPI004041D16E